MNKGWGSQPSVWRPDRLPWENLDFFSVLACQNPWESWKTSVVYSRRPCCTNRLPQYVTNIPSWMMSGVSHKVSAAVRLLMKAERSSANASDGHRKRSTLRSQLAKWLPPCSMLFGKWMELGEAQLAQFSGALLFLQIWADSNVHAQVWPCDCLSKSIMSLCFFKTGFEQGRQLGKGWEEERKHK